MLILSAHFSRRKQLHAEIILNKALVLFLYNNAEERKKFGFSTKVSSRGTRRGSKKVGLVIKHSIRWNIHSINFRWKDWWSTWLHACSHNKPIKIIESFHTFLFQMNLNNQKVDKDLHSFTCTCNIYSCEVCKKFLQSKSFAYRSAPGRNFSPTAPSTENHLYFDLMGDDRLIVPGEVNTIKEVKTVIEGHLKSQSWKFAHHDPDGNCLKEWKTSWSKI